MNLASFIQGVIDWLGKQCESENLAKTTRTELGISRQNEWYLTA